MTTTSQASTTPDAARPTWQLVAGSPMAAVAVIWLCAAATAVLAPDMVTGSQQEHLPIAALTVWLWAALATAYTLMGVWRPDSSAPAVLAVSVIWVAVAIASIAAPTMVTGTDPTQIPLAALVAPVVGAVTTGLVVLHAAAARATHVG